jgi:hypothetical protein
MKNAAYFSLNTQKSLDDALAALAAGRGVGVNHQGIFYWKFKLKSKINEHRPVGQGINWLKRREIKDALYPNCDALS